MKMKNTKPSHRIIALFLTLNFLTSLLPLNLLYASNNGPNAPEAASFEPVDATDMVNLATGDFSYVLPLLNVPSPEGGYPLALSYHAGIGLDQEASWVGLGWNINPGAINRSVVGVPDDWKNGLKSKISFDVGGTTTIEKLSMGAGVTDEISAALNATWVTNKAVGGEKSIDFTYNVGVSRSFDTTDKKGINHENSLGFSVGNNGFSMGLGRDGNQIGLTHGKSGTGISFKSESNKTSFRGNVSFSDRTNSSSSLSTIQVGDAINVNLNLCLFNIKYSRAKFKYWQYDEKDYWATGSLYAGKVDELNASDPLYYFNEFDATESPDSRIDGISFAKNNPTYITYDIYNIDAQGLNISASPKLLELGKVHSPSDELTKNSIFIHANDNTERYLTGIRAYQFDRNLFGEGTGEIKSMLYEKSLDNPINRPNFYIENEYSSYSQTNITGRTDFLTNQNEADWFDLMYHIGYTTNHANEGFNEVNKKLKKSAYIEVFTNQEIQDNENTILKVPNLNRNEMPMDGIGAYSITSADGKTYHYSLPVYQKEKGSVVTKSDQNIENNYFEEHSLQPYATHWLLTGITGPDYIDDGDNMIDKGDAGYWIRFDYGKWSDGYTWRMPKTGYNYTDNAKSFSWGAKDIYYLNSIVTRTHTALFIKDVRLDNHASPISKKEGIDDPVYREAIFQGGAATDILSVGADGYFYWAGAYERLEPANDIWAVFSNDNTIKSENWFYYNSSPTPTLLLKEIILLKNDKVPQSMDMLSMSDGNYDQNNAVNFEIHFEEKNKYEYKTNDNWKIKESEKIAYVDNLYRGEYNENVLDVGDYDFDDLKQDAIKSVAFEYFYSLGNDNLGSKLTLKSVKTAGKEGTSLIPPYRFTYFDENSPINISKDDFDDWGYYKSKPYLWSLKEIQNPLGGKILMEYESDDFYEKSVASAYLDHNLQIKFEGTNLGAKYVSVRQDPEIEPEQVLDLTNYFSVGDECELDIQYFYNPNHNGHNWIADVAGQGIVTSVSNTIVKFQIPTNSNKGWVRLKTNCHKKNWVYYQSGEYGHVVDKTKNWKGENRELYCHQPEDEEETVKIKVRFNQNTLAQIGGGIRTKKIIVESENGNTYETQYQYNQIGVDNSLTNITSGTTSYAPVRKYQKDIPYIDLQPSPGVLYQNVRVTHPSGAYSDYAFNTLTEYTFDNSGYESNVLKIAIDEGFSSNVKLEDEPLYFLIDEKFYEVENKVASLGVLISKKEYNSYGQLTNSIVNTYFDAQDFQGKLNAESYVKEESLGVHDTHDIPINLSTTRISYLPSVLKKTEELVEGNSYVTNFENFDPITGRVTEIRTSNSKGVSLKSKVYPAYSEYPAMGSKVDNPANKNMLTQEAMAVTEIQDANQQWQKISANITTWNPETYKLSQWVGEFPNEVELISFHDVWRKHKTFTWNGDTDTEGYYVNYVGDDDGFDWSDPNAVQPVQWKQLSEITQYNTFSTPLEVKDINGNLAATKMGYGDTKTIAICNAGYGETFYSGAEDDDGQGNFGGGVSKGTASITTDSHTGEKALLINNGENGFKVTVNHGDPQKRFKISLWAKNNNYSNVKVNVGGENISYNPAEIVQAGDWVQLNFYADIPSGTQLYVMSINGGIRVDDFRVHPISSSMTSYVYNQWDELTHILGPNNMATQYEYDEAGRLLRIYNEVENVDQIYVGGFKKVKEYAYTYKSPLSP
ncbi:hypothetical protein [Flagellimonas beolgyonensis]|uniref:hypothetical protein n=2 Tax=Flavobacteriaceae TaxID=49546 RepID=UPI003D6534B0